MHVGKLLARLNPTTVRYDIGRGGTPELTPQDIAAAVAMIPPGLGRELLCRIWWPDGAALTAKELDRMLMEAQLSEWRRRMDALVTAQIMAACAETPSQRSKATSALASAKANAWPRLGQQSCYEAIRKAVLVELSAPCLCGGCKGRGEIQDEVGRIVSCEVCESSGQRKLSDRARAELIGRDEATYRRVWRPVYEWVMVKCDSAAQPALQRLADATGY